MLDPRPCCTTASRVSLECCLLKTAKNAHRVRHILGRECVDSCDALRIVTLRWHLSCLQSQNSPSGVALWAGWLIHLDALGPQEHRLWGHVSQMCSELVLVPLYQLERWTHQELSGSIPLPHASEPSWMQVAQSCNKHSLVASVLLLPEV